MSVARRKPLLVDYLAALDVTHSSMDNFSLSSITWRRISVTPTLRPNDMRLAKKIGSPKENSLYFSSSVSEQEGSR